MEKRFYDRRWGGFGLTLTVVFLMCAANAFATTTTDNPAQPYSEVTATNDEVVVGATSTVVATPAAIAPNLGADSATAAVNLAGNSTSPPFAPGNRILMGASNAMTHDSAFTGATGWIFTEFTGAVPDNPTTLSSSPRSVPTDNCSTQEAWRWPGIGNTVGNNADANSFGNADPP